MIYTEITPNPASLKFVTQRIFLRKGSVDFPDVAETEDSPLAKKLFDFKFVEGVFISANFITITKNTDFQWEDVIPTVKDFLKAYLSSGEPVFTGELEKTAQEETISENDSELVKRIKELLESHVRPAVASDGGDIIYHNFEEDGTLKLQMQGSCSGCPSSLTTLKLGIENLMTRMIPEVKKVEAV
ncbi:MAG: NifU family protein [Bacteroidia bacterium]|nr:NifU family protein [Bacteroidia bacterium]